MESESRTYHLTIKRYHASREPAYYESRHVLQFEDERPTVLQALIAIYENEDPDLAFCYNCRYLKCGLCAVEVDGKPVLACVTPLQEGQTIGPLANLPLHRDLVIERRSLQELLLREKIFRVPGTEKNRVEGFIPDFPELKMPPNLEKLLGCIECLCCQASCPTLAESDQLAVYAGPYIFVKLAQLHLDPLDDVDRVAQAARLGIESCRACGRCSCPQDIDIQNQAILPLQGKVAREVKNRAPGADR